jgi:DNA-binding beta-propeller fold protein YncE
MTEAKQAARNEGGCRNSVRDVAVLLYFVLTFSSTVVCADDVLKFESRIPLGAVAGRVDHIAIDVKRQRAFVAELGNNTVSVVDLKSLKLLKRITGLKEPQGLAWVAASERLFVANAGDGMVRMFSGDSLAASGEISLGADADNIRIDSGRIFVGYGNGGIAILDGAKGDKIGDVRLAAHPEGFEIEPGGKRIFVNEPTAGGVAVVAIDSGKELARWAVPKQRGNYPMALNSGRKLLIVVYRNQPSVTVFDTDSGAAVSTAPTCGDADDIFFDAKRNRVYVSCGEGFLAVLKVGTEGQLQEVGRVPTRRGARTALFEPVLDRLFVGTPAQQGEPAELRVYRP